MKKNQLTVLLLGGGRKVVMAQMLRRSCGRLGLELRVVSYELRREVPIAVEGEVVQGLPWDHPQAVDDVMRVAIQHEVDIILPLADGAIGIAAACREKLSHVFVPTPDADTSEMLFDRTRAAKALKEAGIPTPHNYTVLNAEAPVIAKPRRGSTARNVKIFHDIDSLMQLENISDYFLQEYIPEFDEYAVDCYCDTEGRLLTAVPVKRLEVLGGEIIRSVSCRMPEMEALCKKIADHFPLLGPFTVEFLFDKRKNRYVVTHVTPRLGDSVSCAVYSGAPITDYIICQSRGIPVEPFSDWSPNTLIANYRQPAVFHNYSD